MDDSRDRHDAGFLPLRNKEQVLFFTHVRLTAHPGAFGAALLFLVLWLPMDEAFSGMFWFMKKHEIHLSPEVQGQLLKYGEPVEGAPIFRELFYDGDHWEDQAITDSSGRFHFPEKIIRSSAPGRPLAEPRNVQVITVDWEDETYLLWHVAVDAIGPSATLERLLQNLNCDLTTPEVTHHFPNTEHPDFTHDIGSICRWPDSATAQSTNQRKGL